MTKPALLVMAAGMGSRYGGPKQIDAVHKNGEIIIDYSLYDAKKAGFEKLVFIVNKKIYPDFKDIVGKRAEKNFDVHYVFQQLENIPAGYNLANDRIKPLGTAHAVLCAKDVINSSFAVINADDFYGYRGFESIYEYLNKTSSISSDGKLEYCMVGYELQNTITEHGYVARGICQSDNGFLSHIVERTRIEKKPNGIAFTEDDGKTYELLPANTIVSMNFWGFRPQFFDALQSNFYKFLDSALVNNPLKAEYFLPSVVDVEIKTGNARVKVLPCKEQWYGVTYKEDKAIVVNAIANMVATGKYPSNL